MKTTKETLKRITEQARVLNASPLTGYQMRKVVCELQLNGKTHRIGLPENVLKWLKSFDALPEFEITETPSGVFFKSEVRQDRGRISRICGNLNDQSKVIAPVLLRVEDGELQCVERVAKLKTVEVANGKKFARATVIREENGVTWCFRSVKGWITLYAQKEGQSGAATIKERVCKHGGRIDFESVKMAGEALDVWFVAVAAIGKTSELAGRIAESCEKEEREAREAMGEEVPVAVKEPTPDEGIAEPEPVAEHTPPAPIEAVKVVEPVKVRPVNPLLARLRHHVSGAIERGESVPVVEKPPTPDRGITEHRAEAVLAVKCRLPSGEVMTRKAFVERQAALHGSYVKQSGKQWVIWHNGKGTDCTKVEADYFAKIKADCPPLTGELRNEDTANAYSKPVQVPPATVETRPVKPSKRAGQRPFARDWHAYAMAGEAVGEAVAMDRPQSVGATGPPALTFTRCHAATPLRGIA